MLIKNIDRESDKGLLQYRQLLRTDSELFQEVEKIFDDYIEGRGELEEMYFSDDAIYTKKGAIQQAIESIFDTMDEEGLKSIKLTDPLLDLEANFD